MRNMKYYALNKDYVLWLMKFDNKIENIDYGDDFKPYIGIAFEVNNIKYFILLSSYKKKYIRLKDDIDFLKITNLKNKGDLDYWVYGALNINNMIPVPDSQIELLNMENLQKYKKFESEKTKNDYRMLLENEYLWIKKNRKLIQNNAYELYAKVTEKPENNKGIVKRCCNWTLLEEKCKEYENIQKELNNEIKEQSALTKE